MTKFIGNYTGGRYSRRQGHFPQHQLVHNYLFNIIFHSSLAHNTHFAHVGCTAVIVMLVHGTTWPLWGKGHCKLFLDRSVTECLIKMEILEIILYAIYTHKKLTLGWTPMGDSGPMPLEKLKTTIIKKKWKNRKVCFEWMGILFQSPVEFVPWCIEAVLVACGRPTPHNGGFSVYPASLQSPRRLISWLVSLPSWTHFSLFLSKTICHCVLC